MSGIEPGLPGLRGEAALPEDDERSEVRYLRFVLIAGAIVVIALALWAMREALLLAFAGVLVAVLLLALARPIEQRTGMGRPWTLLLLALLLVGIVGGLGMVVGAEVQRQVAGLAEALPEALRSLGERFGVPMPSVGEAAGASGGGGAGGGSGGGASGGSPINSSVIGTVVGHVASAGAMTINAISAFVVAFIGGFFLAGSPDLYRKGATRLLPRSQQQRADEVLLASGRALEKWLKAQLVSMTVIAVLTGIGLWWIDIPSPLALALFAGLAGFIPLLGGVLGAVPALLLALSAGGEAVLWTAGLFLAVQQIESNMIMPLVEKRLVSMPPALLLFAVVGVGALFGLPGVLLAAPITVVVMVFVTKLYVRQTLGNEAEVPGEQS